MSSRPLAGVIERLRTHSGSFALHETTAAARPYILAAIARALNVPVVVVVATADVAERTFADLTYYLDGALPVSLARPRDDSLGVIESPSERSARMTLLADLLAGHPLVAVVPVAALRQFVMPPSDFAAGTFTLGAGDEPGWEATLERLHALGYNRSDVVAAAGEYAVRGGIIDVFAATADQPVRLEFFGDAIESVREFELTTQRSLGEGGAPVTLTPWLEVPRDVRSRDVVLERLAGPPGVVAAVRAHLASGADVPEAWLSLVFEQRATFLDYLAPAGIVVLEEPALLATVERGLDEERSREERVLLARSAASDPLSVRDEDIGDDLCCPTWSRRTPVSPISARRCARGARSSCRVRSKAANRCRGCPLRSKMRFSKRARSITSRGS